MSTVGNVNAKLGLIPGELAALLRTVDQAQGRQTAFAGQFPERLESLQKIARIQSTEASNEIEGITAPAARIRALVEEKTTPQNRSEEEIAGYRSVLDLINSTDAAHIPFTENVILQFHQQLYSFSPGRGGEYKNTDNEVTEELPDGGTRVRFKPTPAWKTKEEMRLLHEAFTAASASGKHHPLVLTAAYILDFLLIHPFRDGNGRMSRLLTLLLLYQGNYDVGRFISVEKIIAESNETYYESLAASTTNWETDGNDPIPWIRYFLGVLIRAYTEFEARTGALGRKGAKSEAIRAFVRSSISTEFTIKDIRKACPGVSDDLIRKVLSDLRAQRLVDGVSKGPSARYRRLGTTDASRQNHVR